MDLWERIQELRQRGVDLDEGAGQKEMEDLYWRRREEIQAELPVPFCCPTIAGTRLAQAVVTKDGLAWHTPYRHNHPETYNTDIMFCPHCGQKLPGFRLKVTPPPHLMIDQDGYRCGLCGEDHDCLCSLPQSAWEVEDAPPVGAVTSLINDHSYPKKYLSVSRKDNHEDKGLPGGKVEPGETLEQAMCRELLQETGLVAVEYHRVLDIMDDVRTRAVVFRVTKVEGRIHTTESGLVEWLSGFDLTTKSSFRQSNTSLMRVVDPWGRWSEAP